MINPIRLRLFPSGVVRATAVLACLLAACGSSSSPEAGPRAASGQVQDGKARFTVTTPTLIRMEYAADGRFEDGPTQTVAERPATTAAFERRVEDGELVIDTGALRLRYRRDSGPFGADNLVIRLRRGDEIIDARPDWSYAPQPGNLGGWRRGLDNERDPQPLFEGLLSRAGWYLLNDSRTVLLTDAAPGFAPRPDAGGVYQDGYLFGYGLDYAQGLADLRTLTGAAPLLPKKALGVWFSRWWSYTDPEWREQVRAFQQRGVPLDTISIDTDWKRVHNALGCIPWNAVIRAPLDDACSWNGWDWNRDIFPDPDGFVTWLHEQGLDVGLNVHPSIAGSDPAYPAVEAQTGGLMRDDADLPCELLQADPSTPCYVFDWTQPAQLDAYFGLHRPIEATGIDFWWLDWCCEGARAQAPGLSADTFINAAYAKQHEAMGSRWPAFSRIGSSFQSGKAGTDNNGLGAFAEHRSTIHFTGDTCSTWELMAFQAEMTASEGNIGLPYVSHDIGSFLGEPLPGLPCINVLNTNPNPPDDMYLRWIQFGTFEPIMRLHSHHGNRLPWDYGGETEAIATRFLRLRGQLVPTLYTLSRVAHDSGLPMARALYLQWPEHEAAYQYRSQYTVGADMLVASVAAPGDPANISLWIPPGEWVDFFTGEVLSGPAEISRSVPLEHYAVFLRKGAILPLQPELLTSAHGPQDGLTLQVWPGADGEFRLYEDEGRGFAYRDGAYRWTPIRFDSADAADCHRLSIEAAEGQAFPGGLATRSWTAQFNGIDAPQRVRIDGLELPAGSGEPGWNYDAGARTLSVATGVRLTDRTTVVAVGGEDCR
jgi:alpha-glucosidase (family GH31 glycosyl hydrolase)